MKCQLCLRERDLCNSHIISEFLYRPLYDDIHRFAALKPNMNRPKLIQKGFREYLLCSECEGVLGKYESYFAMLWYQSSKRLPASTRRNSCYFKGLDYTRFKLFHLSILWRASVSSLDGFFHAFLGPHEDTIRSMLLTADPKTQSDYPIAGSVVLKPGSRKIFHGLIMPPSASTIDGVQICMSVFGGCVWQYAVGTIPTFLSRLTLKDDGRLTMPVIDAQTNETIRTFLQDVA
jgi:hypothetical protein